jgi:hypothetical protein
VERNKAKYPADKCKGRSDKYTAYQETSEENKINGDENKRNEIKTTTSKDDTLSSSSSSSSSSSATPSKVLFPSLDENRSSPTASLITRFNVEAKTETLTSAWTRTESPSYSVIIGAVLSGSIATYLVIRALKR